jgi:hypothetical protein
MKHTRGCAVRLLLVRAGQCGRARTSSAQQRPSARRTRVLRGRVPAFLPGDVRPLSVQVRCSSLVGLCERLLACEGTVPRRGVVRDGEHPGLAPDTCKAVSLLLEHEGELDRLRVRLCGRGRGTVVIEGAPRARHDDGRARCGGRGAAAQLRPRARASCSNQRCGAARLMSERRCSTAHGAGRARGRARGAARNSRAEGHGARRT